MKILITTDTYAPSVNGVVTSIRSLCAALSSLGHEVRILTLAPKAERSYQEDNVYYLRSFRCAVYPDARLTIAFRDPLLRKIEEWSPDIIHSQTEFSAFFCARHLARRLGIPLVHTYHTLYEDYTCYFSPSKTIGAQAIRSFTRLVSRSVTVLCAPSVKVQQTLMRYRVHAPISVLPTGIDLSRFGHALPAQKREALLRGLDLPQDAQVVLSLGRIAEEKNYDVLLQNVAPVLRERENTYFLVVGDGPYREELEKQVDFLGLRDKVRFSGMVAPGDVPAYYMLGDVFVCASTSETQGLTYLEAMASGLPQVVQKDDCLLGVVNDGENGFQYTSPEECANRLRTLLDDDAYRGMMSENAKAGAHSFGMEVFGERAESCYRALLSSAVPARSAVLCE
ncbi:glycosyltransferase family 4 protein [Intestinibacillus massiliensis]|nr:glycosyltransferase family 4 protein [Intestinibacillus massiliensis]